MLCYDREKMLLSCINLYCMLLLILCRTLHGLLVLCELNLISFGYPIIKLAVWFVIGALNVFFSNNLLITPHSWCRYLKSIDRFNDLVVSVYVTAGHILYIWDQIHIWYFWNEKWLLNIEFLRIMWCFSLYLNIIPLPISSNPSQ